MDLVTSQTDIEKFLMSNIIIKDQVVADNFQGSINQDFYIDIKTPNYLNIYEFMNQGSVNHLSLFGRIDADAASCDYLDFAYIIEHSLFTKQISSGCKYKIFGFDYDWQLRKIAFFSGNELTLATYSDDISSYEKLSQNWDLRAQNVCDGSQSYLNTLNISLICTNPFKLEYYSGMSEDKIQYTIYTPLETSKYSLEVLSVDSAYNINYHNYSLIDLCEGGNPDSCFIGSQTILNARKITIADKVYNYDLFVLKQSNDKDFCAKNKKDCNLYTYNQYFLNLSQHISYNPTVFSFMTTTEQVYKNGKLVTNKGEDQMMIKAMEEIMQTTQEVK